MTIRSDIFQNNSLSGTTSVRNGFANVNIAIAPYGLTGNINLIVQLRRGSIDGEILSSTPVIPLVDISRLFSFEPNVAIISEGQDVRFDILTNDVPDGARFYYAANTVSGNVTEEDFLSPLTGTLVINNNQANILISTNSIPTTAIESGEIFDIKLRVGSLSGEVVATSNVVEILDTANLIDVVNVLQTSNIISESESITFNISTINALGSNSKILYYTIGGNADIYTGQSGSFLVSGNQANLQLIAESSVPQGEERNFTVEFRRDSISGPLLFTSQNVTVKHFGGEIPANILYGNSTIIYDEANNYLTAVYRTSSNINVISASPLPAYNTIDYLAIAGGGGGGSNAGAGGGAGGLLTGRFTLNSSNTGVYAVVVGAGGTTGDSAKGTPGTGSNLNIIGIFTRGGGGGGHGASTPGLLGGSGGGSTNPGTAGANVILQGNPGGTGGVTAQGGGGGAGAAGTPGAPSPVAGTGGIGLAIPWMPVGYGTDLNNAAPPTTLPRYFAGGGGASPGPTARPGGAGGGGNGGDNDNGTATAGRSFTGGGGGGVGQNFRVGRAGGSGIVAIRQLYSNLWLTYGNVSPLISIVRSVEANTTIIHDGSSVLFTVDMFNSANGEILYYTTLAEGNGTINSNAFISGNTGSFTINGNVGSVVLIRNTNDYDDIFKLQVRRNSISGPVLGNSQTVTARRLHAVGGTLVEDGSHVLHVFTSSSNLLVRSTTQANILIVGGGGGGERSGTPAPIQGGGGGGGAGGLILRDGAANAIVMYSGNTYPIVIGAGGGQATAGGNTTAFTMVSLGGGRGLANSSRVPSLQNGGSGGGGGFQSFGNPTAPIAGGSGIQRTSLAIPADSRTYGFGNGGGASSDNSFTNGGGGGAGAAAGPGPGGIGIVVQWIPGLYGAGGPTPGRYFAGGGGSSTSAGGAGGGGTLAAGNVNTGGGGAGGSAGITNDSGKLGGSGIVIIRYPKP